MTVGTQIQQAIASVQSAAASLKTFSLEQRQQYIESQEPQYKQ